MTLAEQARTRAEVTGSRYVVARQEVLRDAGPQPTGGVQPDIAATANALRRAGVAGPTGGPLDEVDVLGLGGGLGFMVAVFEYAGFGPTMTITTRTVSTPDPFVASALERLGAEVEVATTGSATLAQRSLDAALDAGHQVLCSVETGALPYRGHDGSDDVWLGTGPRIIGVVARDGEQYVVDDRALAPLQIDAASLARARGVVKKVKHRSLIVTGATAGHDPVAATRAALARTVSGYAESPAKSFVNNIGTAGLRTWASRLTATNAKGWARVFADPAHLHDGLRRVAECIDHELTAPAAGRPMFVEWLARAREVTGIAGLDEVAHGISASGERWRALSDLAAGAAPSIAAAVAGIDRATALLDEHGAADSDALVALRAQVDACAQDATLGGAQAWELLAQMAVEALAIADLEADALALLGTLLRR